MQMLDIPALAGEFLPAGTKFNIPAIPDGSSDDLMALFISGSALLVKDAVEKGKWLGEVLHKAQATLYREKTGKRMSDEMNERRGQLSTISPDWDGLCDRYGLTRERAKRVLQAYREPEKFVARMEADRDRKTEYRAAEGKGGVRPLPSQVSDSSARTKTVKAAVSLEELRECAQDIKRLVEKVTAENRSTVLEVLNNTRQYMTEVVDDV